MRFANIIGQKNLIEKLISLVDHNRLSHALLFTGREGSGALPLALAFTTYLIEKENKAEPASAVSLFGEPVVATENESGKKADKYIHPDIHFSYPVIPKKPGDKPVSTTYINEWRDFLEQNPYGNVFDWLQSIGAENKQGNITAAECADILHKLQLKSFEGSHKILLMWMPEYLGNEGNKLLKIIEEPPPKTLFILVAEKEENILPTIISRCQTIRVPAPEATDIASALVERCKIDHEQAIQIAGMSNGNYREALQLLQHAENDWQVVLRDWLNTLIKADTIGQVNWSEEMSRYGREKQKQFLQYFTHLIECSLRLRLTEGATIEISDKEKDFSGRLNKLCHVGQLEAIAEELDKASYYIERNANPKMLFTALSIKLFHIIRNQAVPVVH
jgi:DNA polymerase-3 subunit delta'